MQAFNKILVTTDFSSTCENALRHASGLAERSGAELHVVHVQVVRHPNDAVNETLEKAHRKWMRDFVSGLDGKVVTETLRGEHAASAIERYAQREAVDLIVMGTHARTGISRMFLGSVAAEVLRVAQRPALVVGQQHAPPDSGYKNIVLPVDLSEEPEKLRRRAVALAEGDSPGFQLVYVDEHDDVAERYAPEYVAIQRKRCNAAIGELVEAAGLPGRVQSEILGGLPDEEISRRAAELDADVIVMGCESRSRQGALLLGSTTDRVLRQAPCAVLAWRDKK